MNTGGGLNIGGDGAGAQRGTGDGGDSVGDQRLVSARHVAVIVQHPGVARGTNQRAHRVEHIHQRKADDGGDKRQKAVGSQAAEIKLEKRVGFLDKKLQVVSKMCDSVEEWLKWAEIAYKSSYGYEWQGDNLLLARENLLYTLKDFYNAKFGKSPALSVLEQFAGIIAWNIFQMDGLKMTIPYTGHETKTEMENLISGATLFDMNSDELMTEKKKTCPECKVFGKNTHHPKYVKIMLDSVDICRNGNI